VWISVDSVVGVVTSLRAGVPKDRSLIPSSGKGILLSSNSSRPAVWLTSLLLNGAGRFILCEWSCWCHKLTTYLYQVLRLRMSGAVTPLSHMPSCRAYRKHFCLYINCRESCTKTWIYFWNFRWRKTVWLKQPVYVQFPNPYFRNINLCQM
jgi:hypothetical protein